jgi:hypothetical protein
VDRERGPWRVAAGLVAWWAAGVVVSAGVAGVCAKWGVWGKPMPAVRSLAGTAAPFAGLVVDAAAREAVWRVEEVRGIGCVYEDAELRYRGMDAIYAWGGRCRAGWPLECMEVVVDRPMSSKAHGATMLFRRGEWWVRPSGDATVLRPAWAGVVVDGGFWAGVVWGVCAAMGWAWGRVKWKKGTCRKCGYDLSGNVSGVCPECGSGLR